MLNNIPWKKILMVLYIILVILSVLVVAGFLYLKFGVRPPDVEEPTPSGDQHRQRRDRISKPR